MRFAMGNHNSALLEAASTGNTSKAQQLLDKPGAVIVDWKGQVSSQTTPLP